MAYLQLLRLAGAAMPSITTSNVNYQYYRKLLSESIDFSGDGTAAVSYTLAMTDWVYGNGDTVTVFATGTAGYSMLIQGALQQTSLYNVTATHVALVAPATGSIQVANGAPISLQTTASNTFVSTTRTFALT